MSALYLGVDGGQSSTTALIGDETGRVIGQGRGGPCNHVGAAEGRQKFTAAIDGCVGQALEQAGLNRATPFAAACLGFSGGAADKEPVLKEFLRAGKMKITHDAWIALSGAHAGGPGIITIAGTGSISFGRNAEGKTARSGGWGFLFGDEGGGFDLVKQALRSVLRFEEGWGPETTLRPRLLEATGARDAQDLLHRFYTTEWPRPRIAQLSHLVAEAAAAGDRVAEDTLHYAAAQLNGITAACRKQLFPPGTPVNIAPIGGVFQIAPLRARYVALVENGDHAHVIEPHFGPAAGALLEAYALDALPVTLSGVRAEKT